MTVKTHRLAFIGFGVVGQALTEIIQTNHTYFKESYQLDLQVVAVSSLSKGSLYNPAGLDLQALLTIAHNRLTFAAYPDSDMLQKDWDNLKIISHSNADTIVEMAYTDIETGQPAIDHCRTAFECGKNVATCNKGPVALAYASLAKLAQKQGVQWGIESTVLSGTPALQMPRVTLTGNEITEIYGILNGTTNYILSEMEKGQAYNTALQQAQKLGYAEADPTADVEGYDVLGKVIILSNVLLNHSLNKKAVPCQGISHLTLADIETAKAENKRWKLIGRLKKENGQITAMVGPEMLPLTHPLAQVRGATNAITYQTNLLGPVTLIGAGAGGKEAAAGVLADILNIAQS